MRTWQPRAPLEPRLPDPMLDPEVACGAADSVTLIMPGLLRVTALHNKLLQHSQLSC